MDSLRVSSENMTVATPPGTKSFPSSQSSFLTSDSCSYHDYQNQISKKQHSFPTSPKTDLKLPPFQSQQCDTHSFLQTTQNTHTQKYVSVSGGQYSTKSLDQQIQNIFLLKPPPGSKQHVMPRDAVKNTHEHHTQCLLSPQIQMQNDIPHDPLNLGAQAENLSPITKRLQDKTLQHLLQNQVQQQLPLTQEQHQFGNVYTEQNALPHASNAQTTSAESTRNINYHQPQTASANYQNYHPNASEFIKLQNLKASGSSIAQNTIFTAINQPVQNTFSAHQIDQGAQNLGVQKVLQIQIGNPISINPTDNSQERFIFPNAQQDAFNPTTHVKTDSNLPNTDTVNKLQSDFDLLNISKSKDAQIGNNDDGTFQHNLESPNAGTTESSSPHRPLIVRRGLVSEEKLPCLQNTSNLFTSASNFTTGLPNSVTEPQFAFQASKTAPARNANIDAPASAFSAVQNPQISLGFPYKTDNNFFSVQLSNNSTLKRNQGERKLDSGNFVPGNVNHMTYPFEKYSQQPHGMITFGDPNNLRRAELNQGSSKQKFTSRHHEKTTTFDESREPWSLPVNITSNITRGSQHFCNDNRQLIKKNEDAGGVYFRPNSKQIYERQFAKFSNDQHSSNTINPLRYGQRLASSSIDLRSTSPSSQESRYVDKLTQQSRRQKINHYLQASGHKASSQCDLRSSTSFLSVKKDPPEAGGKAYQTTNKASSQWDLRSSNPFLSVRRDPPESSGGEYQTTNKASSQWDLRSTNSFLAVKKDPLETSGRAHHLAESRRASASISDLRCFGNRTSDFEKLESGSGRLTNSKFEKSPTDFSFSKLNSPNSFTKLSSKNFVHDEPQNLLTNHRRFMSMVELRLPDSTNSNVHGNFEKLIFPTPNNLTKIQSRERFLFHTENKACASKVEIPKYRTGGPIRRGRKSVVLCDLLEESNDDEERALKRRKYSNTSLPDYVRDRVRPVKRSHSYKLCEDEHYLTILEQLRKHHDPFWQETLQLELGLPTDYLIANCGCKAQPCGGRKDRPPFLRSVSWTTEKQNMACLNHLSHEPRQLLRAKLKHAQSLMNLSPGSIDPWKYNENKSDYPSTNPSSPNYYEKIVDSNRRYHTIHAGMEAPRFPALYNPQTAHNSDATGSDSEIECSSNDGSHELPTRTDDYAQRIQSIHKKGKKERMYQLKAQNQQQKSSIEKPTVFFGANDEEFPQQWKNNFKLFTDAMAQSESIKRPNLDMLDIKEEKENDQQGFGSLEYDSGLSNTPFPRYFSAKTSSTQNQFQNATPPLLIDHNALTPHHNFMVSGATASQRAAQPHQTHVVHRVRPLWLKRENQN